MTDTLSTDQKIEVLKLALLEATADMVLLTEDRCRKCRERLKNVLIENLETCGVRTGSRD